MRSQSRFFENSAQETTLKWYCHATFAITTPRGKVLMIDPWLKNLMNPEFKDGKDPLSSIDKVDYILITHGHFDHVGEAVELLRQYQRYKLNPKNSRSFQMCKCSSVFPRVKFLGI